MTAVFSTDPRTGAHRSTTLSETTPEAVAEIAQRAGDAAGALSLADREARARLLAQVADRVDGASESLCRLASSETGLELARLESEAARAADQFRLFADVVREGSYLEAAIDHAVGSRPDVRRILVPVGPVAVFGASNFPFAFSVLGGDTASALAAGCPVIAKAHPAHPLTSQLSGLLLIEAAAEALGEPDAVQVVYGFEAGRFLVKEPAIRAATLTGSLPAARALQKVINEREQPIPFFAELGSVNPLVVLEGAARARNGAIAAGLVASFTGSGGQLCTKPGFAFVPDGPEGDALVDLMRNEIAAAPLTVMLSENIRDGFTRGVERFLRNGAVITAAGHDTPSDEGFVAAPTLLELRAEDLSAPVVEECFGPALAITRYASLKDLSAALEAFPASLTVSIHAEDDDRVAAERLLDILADRAGRVIFNGFPTGVRVSWAQHHGGPWPSTNSQHTSVGATAIRRFLRPIAYQDAPEWALPPELRDEVATIPRRVDGRLILPTGQPAGAD
jgi:NADP-dependent aldehyde dehydrogenase